MKKFYFFVLTLAHLSINAQIVNIPDSAFKQRLVSANQWNHIANDLSGAPTAVDTNNDGEIQLSEALNISSLTFNQTQITDLTGIQSFTNLAQLTVQGNSHLNELNVSNMANLKRLFINSSGLHEINTQGCNQLENFQLIHNAGFVYNLDFLQNPSLKKLTIITNAHLASVNISHLTALEELEIGDTGILNPNFTSLDLSNNINLKKIIIDKPNLTSLTLNPLSQLEHFSIKRTKLTSLDLSNRTQLEYLYVDNNSLLNTLNIQNTTNLNNLLVLNNPLVTTVDLQNKPNLQSISFGGNGVTSVDFTGTPGIINMAIGPNKLTSLDTSPITQLQILSISENLMSSLDVSQNPNLEYVNIQGNILTNVNIKNGNPNMNFYAAAPAYLPNLKYVCCDTSKVQQVSAMLVNQGQNNAEVNSYCSFIPGGNTYTIQGNTKYDVNNNGCDASDPAKSFQQFTISNGTNLSSYIANSSGNYTIATQDGTSIITPVVENPAYFNISPASISVDFPTQASPFSQNFCMTPNGTHNDLETVIIPVTAASPGFLSRYKIIYKNKGTAAQSGALLFNYDDTLMDYQASTLAPDSQSTGVINWNFTNLQPFETREIIVSLRLNTPTQTPALHGGDLLQYTAHINGATDETPSDNTFTLDQTVVNAFDPNDKTCLEGASITQAKVGDYVHYLIRFENTGTANARNIVVKDEIDTTKFDISSLVALNGSHDFVTQITQPNVVEFIFENIQLPFDDTNNDGYVAFKIKTKSTLNLGDSFSNTAKIYFDYNHPIITNTYTTSVQNKEVLAISETNRKTEQFTLYPNPAKDTLYIESKEEIIKAEIYDLTGRIINSTTAKGNSVNVSELTKGNYIIKMFTKDKTFTQKFKKD
ncbi:T9SS type A sorting domain-containing protein [Chryseobacterium gallinarum]|uniref:DUF7619 domain-containing protein n=1 Tax=Chryseobacterium gallinarum TaxID=1324352 RepID=UPI0020257533|nr:T9SS type A sorting domain-containing protein [Chryseobacterium gallinarum]MCL8537100.1 T9SS type A sorting domain-containing protein [Chryseobacterium gallinarum]